MKQHSFPQSAGNFAIRSFIFLGLLALQNFASQNGMAASTWDGGGSDNNWSTAANWTGDVAPISDPATSILMAGSVRLGSIGDPNNVNSAFTLASLAFNSGAGSFYISGQKLTFADAGSRSGTLIINNSSSLQTINNDIKIIRGQIHSGIYGAILNGNIDVHGGSAINFYSNKTAGIGAGLTLNGVISGTLTGASIQFTGNNTGTGLVTINGNNTYVGTTGITGSVVVGVNALESGGAFGASTTEVTFGGFSGINTISLLTGGAYEVGRTLRLISNNGLTNNLTLGGNTAAVSSYSKDIFMGQDNLAAQSLSITAATGGRVNVTGNLRRAVTGATGSLDTLTKIGSGIVSLTGTNNTYSGVTNINAGTLLVNGKLSGTSNGTVTVKSDAVLGGAGDGVTTGLIERSVVVENGGILSAGDVAGNGSSMVGTLTFGNGLALNNTSKLNFDLGSSSDRIVITGNLTLDGILDVTAGSGFGLGSYELFRYTGTLTNNGLQFGSMPSGEYEYSLDLSQEGFVYLVVPEPSVALLLCGAGAILLFSTRGRKGPVVGI